VQDEKTGLITVTRVSAAKDMKSAVVWVSVLASQVSPASVVKKIKSKSRLIQNELWQKMSTRNVPNLAFKLDENPEYVERIEEILKEIGS